MSHPRDTSKASPQVSSAPARRRWPRLAKLLVLFFLAAWAAPWLVAHSPLRNKLLEWLAAEGDWRVTAGGASFGWVTPLSLSQVTAEHKTLPISARIEVVRCDRTWWGSWLRLPALGQIELQQPEFELAIPQQVPDLPRHRPNAATGKFVVHDATLRLLRDGPAEPLLDFRGLNLSAAIEPSDQGRVLTVQPVRLLDGAELTPELCDAGLQLVAPILARSTAVSGKASLELQHVQVPLDVPDATDRLAQTTVAGTLKLEHVSASLKDTVFRDLATVATQLLRRKLPTTVRVSEGTEVAFALRDGRVYHDGLTFLLPELSSDMEWRTRGSVGLDETLDLEVQTHLPFSLAGESPLLRRLTDNPLEFRITGTLDSPQLQLPPGRPWLQQAMQAAVAAELPEDAQPFAAAAAELLEQLRANAAARQADDDPTALERLRQRIQERREQRSRGEGGALGKKRREAQEAERAPDQEPSPPKALSL